MHTLGTGTALQGHSRGSDLAHLPLRGVAEPGCKRGSEPWRAQGAAPRSRSPTSGVMRDHLLIAPSHTGQQFGSVTEEVSSFQAKTAGRGLARWMVNCSKLELCSDPKTCTCTNKNDTDRNLYLENISQS